MCTTYKKKHAKPEVIWRKSPNFSSRNGGTIKKIVYHYTTSENVDGVVSWLCNPGSSVSAHYVIAKDGTIYQLVQDDQRAWHAYQHNLDSIGIEVCAKTGQKMTKPQEDALKDLTLYLCGEYPTIGLITGHRFLYKDNYTDCPSALFGEATIDSLRVWISTHILPEFPKIKLPT